MSELGGMVLSLAHQLDDDERAELGRMLRTDGKPDTGPNVEPLLSCTQAARRAQCHVETIRRAVARGALSASRAGRSLRIAPSDLDDWLRMSARAPNRPPTQRPARRRAGSSSPMHDALALLERSLA